MMLSPGVRCQQGAWCPFFLADFSLPTAQQAAGTHGAHQLLSAWFPFRVSQTGSVPALLPILGWFAEWTLSLRPPDLSHFGIASGVHYELWVLQSL